MTRFLPFALVCATFASPALAQFGGQPGGMTPGMPQPEEPREEGPAEAAPEDEVQRPGELEPLGGYPDQQRHETHIFELDGYIRLRTDFLHKLHLGQGYFTEGETLNTPPFPTPLECGTREGSCDSNNLGGGNLRLRLEPTINVTDQVRVLSQIDILDNTLLGATPDSLIAAGQPGVRTGRAPMSALYTTQDPPEIGRNNLLSSIRAKRAWGEVDTEFGSLRFGRMPWHFGRGIAFNNGACPDCEGGTNVDRIVGLTQVYGHQVALAWDFGAQGHHAGMVNLGHRDPVGPPLDLSQRDDVFELMAALTRFDTERRFRERADEGQFVTNYGLQLVYRTQGQEVYDLMRDRTGVDAGTGAAATSPTREDLAKALTIDVDALVFLPSLWFKIGWKSLILEFETSGVFGRINNAGPLVEDPSPSRKQLQLLQLGWVMASELRLYRDALFLGFETGGATGDQAENPRTYLNYRWKLVPQPIGDDVLGDFKFNPDYQVDEILFRRILGTVTNAIYFKPSLTYWLDLIESRQVGLSGALLYSLAPVQVSTPGNALSYGVEMNLGVAYRNLTDGFYAGLTWGVLWPMAALNRGIIRAGGSLSQWSQIDDASAAQVLRTYLAIRF